jgi:nucleotide-binding universal stress UspA family protein
VQSALPYLKMAKHIALVQVAEDVLEGAAREQLSDVAKYLRRHGIAVNAKAILHPQGSVSEQLRSAAKEEHADLIVAGAYGHSRLGEWIFGGVTQNLLRHSTVCCLLCN